MRIVGRFSFERFPMGDRSRACFSFVKRKLSFLDLGGFGVRVAQVDFLFVRSVEVRIGGCLSLRRVPMGDRSGLRFAFVVGGLSFLDFGFRCPCGTGGFPFRVKPRGDVGRVFLFGKGSDW